MWSQNPRLVLRVCTGLVILSLAGFQNASGQPQQGERLPQPDEWVAFSAKITHKTAGRPDTQGSFFRSNDGSTCAVMGNPHAPESILTNDVSQGLTYRFVAGKATWSRQPLGIPSSMSHRPPRYRSTMPGLSERAEAYEGMPAYTLVTETETRVLVPALNFFAVMTTGFDWSNQYSNIVLGATLPAVCWPAAGARISDSSTHGGIVQTDRRQNP